jgi:hypothetical protein
MYGCVSIGPVKNPKLLIPVRCTTRKFYLQSPPPGRNDWHVRFTPPAVDGVQREIFRSTGTKEIPAAKRIGAQIIEAPRLVVNDNVTFLGMAKVGTGKSLPA